MMTDSASRLVMRGIRKSFGSVTVLRDVSLACRAGELLAICGENGAGKSTLMKVLGGIHAPDSGEIYIDGKRMAFEHPAAARDAGIAIIHQELALLPHRTVAENIYLGREPSRRGFIDRKAMRAMAVDTLRRVGSNIDPGRECGRLSVAEQQMVEIAKAISLNARILVLDEPTAALDDTESRKLFDLIGQLRSAGVAMLYISHRMAEVMRLADNIAVIKDGQLMATLPSSEATVEGIVRLMVGRELSDFYPPAATHPPGDVMISIEQCGNEMIDRIDLNLHAGEIVGVAGLESSGKSALARAIFGVQPFTRGRYKDWTGKGAPTSPRDAAGRGIGYLPDDRKREGLGLRQSLRDNAALTLRALAGPLAAATGQKRSNRAIDALLKMVEVRAATFTMPAGSLSGGNQQKVLIARWLARQPRAWVVCEPTRGVDVGAKAAIYRLLREYVNAGGAVLVFSSDLAEIIGLCDRVYVMAQGCIVAQLPRNPSEEEIMTHAVRHDVLPFEMEKAA
jgi:ribose transport system ATP-binding protein